MSKFLDDTTDEDFDESTPLEHERFRFGPAIAFYFLMALIGSGAAATWHYYAPDLAILTSAGDVEKLSDEVHRLTQEQGKLTQTINTLQLTQDALNKALASRQQDVDRLAADMRALKADLDALRSVATTSVPRPTVAQPPKHPANPPAKKHPAAKPASEPGPMALSPQH